MFYNRAKRKRFVDLFEKGDYSMTDGKLHFKGNPVESQTLSLLVDVMLDPPMLLVHGEQEAVGNIYSTKYKALEDTGLNIKLIMIDVPIEMYKWVNVIMEISASEWCTWLLMELYYKTLN